MPGAFSASLMRRPAEDIRMLFQHDPVRTRRHLARGARDRSAASMCWAASTRMCSAAASFCRCSKAGGLDGLSIGFKTVAARKDKAAQGAAADQD